MGNSQSMVPSPEPGDTEDVTWALSTAVAMESRGDLYECVRWLRRAAEAAGEASKPERALTLAKAAAELTQSLEENTDIGERFVHVKGQGVVRASAAAAQPLPPAGAPPSSGQPLPAAGSPAQPRPASVRPSAP